MIDIQQLQGISSDSRAIKPGYGFVAIQGEGRNGEDFIEHAIANGATCIILHEGAIVQQKSGIRYCYVPNTRIALATLAHEFYQPQPSNIVAVTGTNGKTSVAYFFMQLCALSDLKSASIGTLGVIQSAQELRYISDPVLTTPDPVTLNSTLNDLALQSVTHVALEASSHGLVMNRLDAVQLKAAAFTNLSRDHLDFHKTYEDYFIAKQRLFTELLPATGIAVLNSDISKYETLIKICATRGIRVISYGKDNKSDLRIINICDDMLSLSVFGERLDIKFMLPGAFQIYNALCAAGLAIALNIPHKRIIQSLSLLRYVPGRMEAVRKLANGATIFIDYAHTPDALQNALLNLKSICHGKVHVVFGCGGQRDQGKRSLMGAVAQEFADHIIITDDNPRNEDPSIIRSAIRETCTSAQEIAGRELAIVAAMKQLRVDDFLLIAGKGHEQYQIIGDTKYVLSDHEIVKRFIV